MSERTRGHNIERSNVRAKLEPRREPYWNSLGTGRAIGFRKSEVGPGTWIARWTEPSKTDGERPKYRMGSLGSADERDYAAALDEANKFFTASERDWKNRQAGTVIEDVVTVTDGCRRYVEHLRVTKGERPSIDAESKFKSTVYDKPLGRIPLDDLEAQHVDAWLKGLVKDGERRGRTANRIFRQLKAALNYLKRLGLFESDNAWKNVTPFNDTDGRRNAFLLPEQFHAILASCERKKDEVELMADAELRFANADLAMFLRIAMVTGARPKELSVAKVSDFDVRTGTLTLTSNKGKDGKSRPREFYITDSKDLKLFKALVQDKLPSAYLLTRADGTPWVYEDGKLAGVPRSRDRSAGMRAAVRDANRQLPKELRIPVPDEQAGRTTVYTLRHTAITEFLDNGAEMSAVADAVGNSEGIMRQHYDQNRKERIRKELAKRAGK